MVIREWSLIGQIRVYIAFFRCMTEIWGYDCSWPRTRIIDHGGFTSPSTIEWKKELCCINLMQSTMFPQATRRLCRLHLFVSNLVLISPALHVRTKDAAEFSHILGASDKESHMNCRCLLLRYPYSDQELQELYWILIKLQAWACSLLLTDRLYSQLHLTYGLLHRDMR